MLSLIDAERSKSIRRDGGWKAHFTCTTHLLDLYGFTCNWKPLDEQVRSLFCGVRQCCELCFRWCSLWWIEVEFKWVSQWNAKDCRNGWRWALNSQLHNWPNGESIGTILTGKNCVKRYWTVTPSKDLLPSLPGCTILPLAELFQNKQRSIW